MSEDKQIATTDESTALVLAIERLAVNPDVDVEKMRALLDMQKEIFEKRAEVAFNQAMTRVQAKGIKIKHDRENKQTQSTYASLQAIAGALTPIATAEGFSLSYGTGKADVEGWLRTTCDVAHDEGHKVLRHVDLPLDTHGIKDRRNKTNMHGAKSAITYGRVILKLMIFDVATADDISDDDGNSGGGNLERDQILTACANLADSIEVIRQGIDEGNLTQAMEAWHELTNDERMSIWHAPTKCEKLGIANPPWTVNHRTVMRSKEWQELSWEMYPPPKDVQDRLKAHQDQEAKNTLEGAE